jgi:hypothetical protein
MSMAGRAPAARKGASDADRHHSSDARGHDAWRCLRREATFVVIEEIEMENWGWGGLPVADYRKKLAKKLEKPAAGG